MGPRVALAHARASGTPAARDDLASIFAEPRGGNSLRRGLSVVRMSEGAAQWSEGKRLGFVFLAVFFALNTVPDLLGAIPVLGEALHAGSLELWTALMPTLGNAALGIEAPIEVRQTGSGDMTWHYVQMFWIVVTSACAALVWTAIDRRRRDLTGAYAWLRVVVRYGLSSAMISYGAAKLVGNQFVFPDPGSLTTTYGDSSPMGLVWNFMGYSTAYCWFTGLAELLGGLLLLSRRTATLGALVSAGVLANVVMINFCFDVPVKLYSSTLMLMAVFLVAHDARRLLDVFVRNRAAPPDDLGRPALSRRLRIARAIARVGFLACMGLSIGLQIGMVAELKAMAAPSPLQGVWEVEAFTLAGAPVSPRDVTRWRQLVIGEYPYAIVRRAQGEPATFGFAHDAAAATITLTERGESAVEHVLAVGAPAHGELVLTGSMGQGPIEVRMRRIDTDSMLLVTRGFRWINEVSFNR